MPLKNRYCFSCVWIDLHNAAYVKVFHQTRYLNILPDVAWAQVGTNDCGNFSLRVFRVCRRSIVPELVPLPLSHRDQLRSRRQFCPTSNMRYLAVWS